MLSFGGAATNTADTRRTPWNYIPSVVFPTGIGRRDDLKLPNCLDVYYGMAENGISMARLDLPEVLPTKAVADLPDAKVSGT